MWEVVLIGQDPATEVANLGLFVCLFVFPSDGTHYQVANLRVYHARKISKILPVLIN